MIKPTMREVRVALNSVLGYDPTFGNIHYNDQRKDGGRIKFYTNYLTEFVDGRLGSKDLGRIKHLLEMMFPRFQFKIKFYKGNVFGQCYTLHFKKW